MAAFFEAALSLSRRKRGTHGHVGGDKLAHIASRPCLQGDVWPFSKSPASPEYPWHWSHHFAHHTCRSWRLHSLLFSRQTGFVCRIGFFLVLVWRTNLSRPHHPIK